MAPLLEGGEAALVFQKGFSLGLICLVCFCEVLPDVSSLHQVAMAGVGPTSGWIQEVTAALLWLDGEGHRDHLVWSGGVFPAVLVSEVVLGKL